MANRLEPGAAAPAFSIQNYDGNVLSLSQFKGKKVWLAFYRYSNCPLCLDHFAEVCQRHQDIHGSGAEMIAIFESKSIDMRNNPCRKANVFFPMIADPEKRLYKLYGAEQSLLGVLHPSVLLKLGKAFVHGYPQGRVEGELGQMPAHFLIRPDGVIDTAHYGTHIADNIPWWKVARFMARTDAERKGSPDPWASFHYR